MQQHQANIIIAGGGLAGLTLAIECTKHSFFDDKTIIILDRDHKTTNDRTWCFWATESEEIPPVPHHSWENCRFFGSEFECLMDIRPYQYHMIRGIDYYTWAKSTISQKANISWIHADIQAIDVKNGIVSTNLGDFTGDLVFNSAIRSNLDTPPGDLRFTKLLQHFTGWHIQTDKPVFDATTMTFMDYRMAQKGETRFVYVLPFSPTEALVEFTVFSPAVCPPEEYALELNEYLKNRLQIEGFQIKASEFGVIPMTDKPLKIQEGRVVHIGTAGGFVKGSSGYAFKRTQRKIRLFVQQWAESGQHSPHLLRSKWRFRFYDSVMLRVLNARLVPGSQFFSQLFQRLPAWFVFRFLDEDSTFAQDVKLLRVPPTWPFLKTAIQQLPILLSFNHSR